MLDFWGKICHIETMRLRLPQLLPFFVLILLMVIVYLTDLHRYFTLENLKKGEDFLIQYTSDHPILTPTIFLSIYVASVCLVIPDSTILTLLAGLIFPLPLAVFYAVFSETLGATIFFLIFHSAFGKSIIQKERPFLNKVRKEFRRHSACYLLFLRLSHIFPFWLTNVCAAYFKVPYWRFIWTTFIGVIPLSFFLVTAGHNLRNITGKWYHLKMHDLFTPEMKIALLILGITALVPIAIHKFRKSKKRWKRK